MRVFLFYFLLVLACLTAKAQTNNPKYDSLLARRLNSDDFGMKKYTLVLLKTGPYEEKDAKRRDSLFRGHMANIEKLVDEGRLSVAGPFMKNELTYRGLFILNTASLEEAKTWLQPDPTIAIGIFEPIFLTWYGSAALPEYLDEADKIWKSKP